MAAGPAGPDAFVGVLARRGRFTVVEPLFERGRRVTVDVRRRADVSLGDMVLVRGARRRPHQSPTVIRSLGDPGTARDVVEALLVERGHARSFPSPAEAEAQAAAGGGEDDPHNRRDLTGLATFTIDPAEARDYDDAVSVEEEGDGLRAYVHIADVGAHVVPGSVTDAEARRRGNSVYVPGTVEPMLPEALSAEACSLVPGAPRRTVTADLRLDGDARVSAVSFYRSVIRSDARLAYEQVERIFVGASSPPERVSEPLARARKLAAALRRRRLERRALGVETSEPEFEFDSDGHVVRAVDDVQTESHGVIEELMILANEQVALTLQQSRRALLYRVHEQPEPAAIEFLAAQLESLDVPTPPLPEHMSPRQAGELAGALGANVLQYVARNGRGGPALTSLVLRSLKQALYSPTNIGHAGLASPSYCHFTSPIRRYPDLVVHRALLAAIGAGEDPPSALELSELGRHCSQTEREAMAVEREADDVCLAFLLERRLNEEGWDAVHEGEVSGVVSGGAFISFAAGPGGAACEGFLPARMLRGEYFDLNVERTALIGRKTGRRLRLADPIAVTVRSVEPPRGRIDLVPAEPRERRASKGRRRPESVTSAQQGR
jgi:ribonuclease R